jgi:nitrous oxidase accessory protein
MLREFQHFWGLSALFLGLSAPFAFTMSVKAEVLTVPSQFQIVREAIAAANPGDTIQVHAGTYTGPFTLDKSLTLEGIGRPVLRGIGRGSVVTVIADRCTIRGFLIEHSGNDLTAEDSGLLLRSNDNRIEANELRDVLYGIYLYHSARNTIRGNTIRGRRELEAGERGAGLHVWNSPDNRIEENTITEARDGIYVQSSPRNVIRRNQVFKLRYGLHYMNSDDNRFEENTFSHNVAGAAIMYSRRIELRRNAFAHNRGFSSFGILFQDCEDSIAEENAIVDNATGIFMEALRRSAFRRNVIAGNDLAIQMFQSVDRVRLARNNFIANLSPLHLVGKRSNTEWQENGRGNYWSEYDGYDLDGDGVGDAPQKVQNVFQYLEGNYPRLRLYLNSASAQALAGAEKSFPIIRGSSETDAAPLMNPETIEIPLGRAGESGRQPTWLGLISLVMLSLGIVTIWKGRRR